MTRQTGPHSPAEKVLTYFLPSAHVPPTEEISSKWSHPFQLPRVIILIESLYDELSAAVDVGVGELGLMTLGNQSSS